MQGKIYSPPAPDDIVLFVESEEWFFYGDLTGGDQTEIEKRDYVIIKFESQQWNELVRQWHESIGAVVSD